MISDGTVDRVSFGGWFLVCGVVRAVQSHLMELGCHYYVHLVFRHWQLL